MDPGFAIVVLFGSLGIIGAVITRMCLAHSERKLKIMSQSQGNGGSEALRSEVDALRGEVARLRDTSTQYDISIQHALEEVQERLNRVESRRPVAASMPAEEEAKAAVAGRSS